MNSYIKNVISGSVKAIDRLMIEVANTDLDWSYRFNQLKRVSVYQAQIRHLSDRAVSYPVLIPDDLNINKFFS